VEVYSLTLDVSLFSESFVFTGSVTLYGVTESAPIKL